MKNLSNGGVTIFNVQVTKLIEEVTWINADVTFLRIFRRIYPIFFFEDLCKVRQAQDANFVRYLRYI